MKLIAIAVAAVTLFGTFPIGGQTRVQRPSKSVTLKSVRNEKLAASFYSGRLPEPLRTPAGRPDEVAATLAKQVAAGTDQSMPALLTAIMAMGFGIRDAGGGITQTVQPGQGLIFEAWEVAAMAKMYGERRTVELSYLTGGLESIPELKQIQLDKIILDGIRKQAVSDQPELRLWARFIVELGRNSEQPYDILRVPNNRVIRLDTIQNALILRRLLGDIYSRGQRPLQARTWKRSVPPAVAGGSTNRSRDQHQHRDSHHRTHPLPQVVLTASKSAPLIFRQPQSQQPCGMSDMEATIADMRATAATSAFGELMSWLEKKLGGSAGDLFGAYGKFANIANIILAYAKFIATYAGLETEITVENPPLVRNTDTRAGQRRQLTAKVSMKIDKFQQVNCFRWLLNFGTGLDFNLMNDGPLPGVGVNWHIMSGGFADFYHSGDKSQQLVWFTGDGPRIQDAGTYAGIPGKGGVPVGNLTSTKTDSQGNARIILEGVSRRNSIPAPHIPVMKSAVIMTTVKLKGGDIKGDAVDLLGNVSGGLISLGKKEGLGGSAGGMFTLPLELLYRTDWASTATIEVPVKDWETCESNAWQGTITYSKEFHHNESFGNEKGQSERITDESVTATITVRAVDRITNGGDININNANVEMNASYNEKYKSIGKRECNRPLERTTDLSGESQSSGSVAVFITPDGRYKVNYQVPTISVEGYHVSSWRLEGDCKNPFMAKSGGSKTLMSRFVEIARLDIDGVVDPAKPHELSGTKSEVVERNGGKMTITVKWDLKRCNTY